MSSVAVSCVATYLYFSIGRGVSDHGGDWYGGDAYLAAMEIVVSWDKHTLNINTSRSSFEAKAKVGYTGRCTSRL